MIPIFLKFQQHNPQSELERFVLINPIEISSAAPSYPRHPEMGTTVTMKSIAGGESIIFYLVETFDKFEEILNDTLRDLRSQK